MGPYFLFVKYMPYSERENKTKGEIYYEKKEYLLKLGKISTKLDVAV